MTTMNTKDTQDTGHHMSHTPHAHTPPDRTAWPRTRLYINSPLVPEHTLTLDKEQSHYITTVLRLGAGGGLRVFNGTQGEWLCTITQVSKKAVTLSVTHQLRPQTNSPDVWLLFAPIKKAGTDMIIQKATELGATRLIPVTTRYSESHRINRDRFLSIAIEAAEQCERLDVPEIAPLQTLDAALADWPENRRLFMANEQGGAPLPSLHTAATAPVAALVGPEGGFAAEDHARLKTCPYVQAISLGPRILRAETAVIVLLAHLTYS